MLSKFNYTGLYPKKQYEIGIQTVPLHDKLNKCLEKYNNEYGKQLDLKTAQSMINAEFLLVRLINNYSISHGIRIAGLINYYPNVYKLKRLIFTLIRYQKYLKHLILPALDTQDIKSAIDK
jgi:hypothetical protein